jgi:MFS family permease/quinol monooxygenase YgiN
MDDTLRSQQPPASAWTPLKRPVFRRLWMAALVSNLGTWMQNMGAGWLMAELTRSPAMVALVQAAQSLPMFLLALPAGALADIVDRRAQLLVAQVWMLTCAAVLAAMTYAGLTTPGWLLILTFLIGCGAAAMNPAWSASVQELVPRSELTAAVALNSMALNLSRAVGPALAGVIVTAAGTASVFLANALSYLGMMAALRSWRRPAPVVNMPAERLVGALRSGFRYARHAPLLQRVLVRGLAFFPFASAVWALLPLIASEELAGGATLYGALLACIGVGAVAGAFAMPWLRGRFSRDRIVMYATLAYAAANGLLAAFANVYVAAFALLAVGIGWIAVLSAMQVAAQIALPPWVRARGLALHMVVIMGCMSAGSVLWGQLAEVIGIAWTLAAAGAGGALAVFATRTVHIGGHDHVDLAPAMHWPEPVPAEALEPDAGPVLVTVEYQVRPEHVNRFLKAMRSVRRMRLRDGAVYWQIFRDTERPERFVEHFITESWAEHLRQHARVTRADRDLETRILALHSGREPPQVTHYLAAAAWVSPGAEEGRGRNGRAPGEKA